MVEEKCDFVKYERRDKRNLMGERVSMSRSGELTISGTCLSRLNWGGVSRVLLAYDPAQRIIRIRASSEDEIASLGLRYSGAHAKVSLFGFMTRFGLHSELRQNGPLEIEKNAPSGVLDIRVPNPQGKQQLP